MNWLPKEIERFETYKNGMTSDDIKTLAILFNRSIDSIDHKRRRLGIPLIKLKTSKRLEKKIFKHKEILEEVKKYTEIVRKQSKEYNDLYTNIKLKTTLDTNKQTEDQVLLLYS